MKVQINSTEVVISRPVLRNSMVLWFALFFALNGLLNAIFNDYPIFWPVWSLPFMLVLLVLINKSLVLRKNDSGNTVLTFEIRLFNETLFQRNVTELTSPKLMILPRASKALFSRKNEQNVQIDDDRCTVMLGAINDKQAASINSFIK